MILTPVKEGWLKMLGYKSTDGISTIPNFVVLLKGSFAVESRVENVSSLISLPRLTAKATSKPIERRAQHVRKTATLHGSSLSFPSANSPR